MLEESHSILRKLTLNKKIKQQINTQTRTKTSSQQIFTNLRANENEKNSRIKTQNI
jgi:hypothetical protein